MALKPDRWEFKTDISYFCPSVTERGVILVAGSSGSGVALDQTAATAVLPGTGSVAGLKPLGLLLNDMVDVNPTRSHVNFLRNEMNKGGKCTLLQQGWVVTNMLVTGITPVAGDGAYLAPSGRITNVAGTPRVGTFLSGKDERGFAKVDLNLPTTA